ncbi:MAG: PTS sugar transporter subunit IIA [Polyangiaceae bacterium]
MNLSVRDAARLLSASERDVYRWIREGSIPVQRVGDRYRFHRAELLEWATSRGIRIAPDEFRAPDANGAAPPSLADALERGGIHHAVPNGDRETALRAVVARMPIDEADRDLVLDFLVAREELGSTGVGDGIAISHVRNPIVLHVADPSITLCFLEHAIDFGAIDGKPVHTVFSMVSPTIRGHLALLSRIAGALHDPAFRAAVMERAPRERILAEARRFEATLAAAGAARA